MGATPVPSAEIARFAREFETSGWDGLAFGESHALLPDPYGVLAAAATATTRLRVRTALPCPPSPECRRRRDGDHPGDLGWTGALYLGRDDGAVKVLQQKPMRVAHFEASLSQLQGFLRREDVEIAAFIGPLDDIDPSLDLPKPGVDVAATAEDDRPGSQDGRQRSASPSEPTST